MPSGRRPGAATFLHVSFLVLGNRVIYINRPRAVGEGDLGQRHIFKHANLWEKLPSSGFAGVPSGSGVWYRPNRRGIAQPRTPRAVGGIAPTAKGIKFRAPPLYLFNFDLFFSFRLFDLFLFSLFYQFFRIPEVILRQMRYS